MSGRFPNLRLAIVGGEGTDTITGPGEATTWNITGADAGKFNELIVFSGVENLTGAAGQADVFQLLPGGSLAVGVIRQLGFEELDPEVVLVGSLYDGSPALTEAMRTAIQAVAPRARLVRLTALPVVGGVLLGMEQVGLATSGLRERLIATTKEMRK